jgi:hypothetical protein
MPSRYYSKKVTVTIGIPLWQFLNQPLFTDKPKAILNPVRFWQHYNLKQLERSWEFDAIQHLEQCWVRHCLGQTKQKL